LQYESDGDEIFRRVVQKPAKTLLRTFEVTKISANPQIGGAKKCQQRRRSERGASLVEILIVVAIAAVMSAMAIPQLIGARRLTRSNAIPNEIMTRLREARQYAMSQRQAFTFVYNDTAKTISIVDQNTTLSATSGLFTVAGFPYTASSKTLMTIPLDVGGVPKSEISYGIPSTITPTAVVEPGTLTPTVAVSSDNLVTVTFQPDGRVLDASSNPVSTSLYFYNPQAAVGTASAVSVLGAGGRVKLFKYSNATNKYVQ
jgi:type II secretory pathway pseudopilin PulG